MMIQRIPSSLAAITVITVALFSAFLVVPPAVAQLRGIDVDTEWLLSADAVRPGSTIKAALQVDLESGYHVNANEPLEDYLIPTVLTVKPPDGFTVAAIVYPEPHMLETKFSTTPLAVLEERFALGVLLEASSDIAPGEYTITADLRYQACDDEKCLAPKTLSMEFPVRVVEPGTAIASTNAPVFGEIDFATATGAPAPPGPAQEPEPAAAASGEGCDVVAELNDFEILATTGGYLERDQFIDFIDRAESGEAEQGFFEGKGPIAIVFVILIGGLALNLTPCVLPLIPINLAIIGAGAQAGSRTRGFLLGGAYGLAMAAVYGVLGLIVILTAGSFGTINSTIWFNVGIAILFVVLGLAMFDVITIDFSKWQAKLSPAGKARKGTFLLAFGMGAISALLAGACVAPVVIQVIVYAGDQYAKGITLALALPFFLGIGMALPWPFAGAGLSFLPKPGPWMVRVKQALGVFILAFAAYYGYLAWEIYDNRNVDPDQVAEAVSEQLEEGWYASMCAGLAAAKAENKPVLVDMWATWCKNCLVMDKTTFKDEEVLARLEDYVKIKFQAEDLEASPANEVLKRFDGIGLPTYAILRPKSEPASTPVEQ